MLENGYIKLHRSLLNWEWYGDINVTRLFVHLLLVANRKPEKWQGIDIGRGQRLTGRKKLSEQTGLSEMEIRTALSRLQRTGEITIKSTNKYSLITIINYDKYQDDNQQVTIKPSNDQPTINQRLTTNGESKKARKEIKDICVFGEFGHVSMTKADYGKLLDGWERSDVDEKISSLDTGIENGHKKYCAYKNHYATLLNWLKKDCSPKPEQTDCVIKPDTNKQKFREGATWDEILDTLDN